LFGAIKGVDATTARPPIGYILIAVTLLTALGSPASGRAEELLQAARDGNAELAIMLVKSGADVRRTGVQGETALHWAAFHGLRGLARVLIVKGASVNARVHNGNTPLHQAAYNGHLEVVVLLVAHGATVGASNQRGFTATQWAQRNGHSAVLSYLVAHGGLVDPALIVGGNSASPASVARNRPRAPPRPKALPTRAAAPRQLPGQLPGQLPASSLRGLSARLGDLPPLVLKAAVPPVSTEPSLLLTPVLEPQPSSTAPPAPAQRAHRITVWIQIGSFRTFAHARTEWRNTISAHGDLLTDLEPTITTTRIKAKGTFHRLRIGPLPRAQARRLCREFKARQRACLLVPASGRQGPRSK